MAKQVSSSLYVQKPKTRGVQAKTKTSNNKKSKLYKKPYRGQGR
jgi:hypothetical protein